jgi:SAM-dependent methyltransferase
MKSQNSENYYDKSYVSTQNAVAFDNLPIYKKYFVPHSNESMTILDFGSGAGFLLASLKAKFKIAVDINASALQEAKSKGIDETHLNLNEINSGSVDLIVSNSALEHVPSPRETLVRLKEILKKEGKIIIRVPHETLGWKYKPGDWNYHLYTWSPMAIGNLMNDVGFEEIKVSIEKSKRTPLFKLLRLVRLERLGSYLYRLFRLSLEELGIYSIAVDGYCIVEAVKK